MYKQLIVKTKIAVYQSSFALFAVGLSTLPATQSITCGIDPLHYLSTFNTLSKTLLQNPRNFTALKTLDSMLTHTQSIDTAASVFVINRLSELKKPGRAKTVVRTMREKGKVSDWFLYSLVLEFLVKDGTFDDAQIVWDDIFGEGYRYNVSDYIIYVCKYGDGCDIKRVCERVLLGSRVLKKETYESLVTELSRVNEGLLAKELVREMENIGFEIDNSIYYNLFLWFCRFGNLDEADSALKKLVRRNFSNGVCLYENFLYALCENGKFREADKLFRKVVTSDCSTRPKNDILKVGKRIVFQLNFKGVIPEVEAYETYIMSLCRVGRLDKAEPLLKKMMKKCYVPKTCVYVSFIEALFKANRKEDAMKFFNLQRKKGFVSVDELAKFVIIGLCEKGRVDDALKVFTDDINSCDDVCNSILIAYWKSKRVTEAEKFFHQLRSGYFGVPYYSEGCYKTMVIEYCNEGRLDEALSIFGEMHIHDVNVGTNRTLYETLIKSLCSHGRFEDALMYLNNMFESRFCASCSYLKTFFNPMLN